MIAPLARFTLALITFALSLSALATELPARTTPHRLAVATRFETAYHVLESGRPGFTVLVVAGIHGNEIAPPEAARRLLDWKLRRGRLAVIPEANGDRTTKALRRREDLLPCQRAAAFMSLCEVLNADPRVNAS